VWNSLGIPSKQDGRRIQPRSTFLVVYTLRYPTWGFAYGTNSCDNLAGIQDDIFAKFAINADLGMVDVVDDRYAGLMSAVFEVFERKEFSATIVTQEYYQPRFFEEIRQIVTDHTKAKRVLKGLANYTSYAQVWQVWRAFLSEDIELYQAVFSVVIDI